MYHWRATKRTHIAQYNKCDLRCEGSDDIAISERKKRKSHCVIWWLTARPARGTRLRDVTRTAESRTSHGEDYKRPWDCGADSLLRSLLCTTVSRPKTRSPALFLVGELLICCFIRQRNIKNRAQDYRKTSVGLIQAGSQIEAGSPIQAGCPVQAGFFSMVPTYDTNSRFVVNNALFWDTIFRPLGGAAPWNFYTR